MSPCPANSGDSDPVGLLFWRHFGERDIQQTIFHLGVHILGLNVSVSTLRNGTGDSYILTLTPTGS